MESIAVGSALLYRLLKIGGLPTRVRRVLDKEGVVMVEEGVSGWITMKDFRSPGRYASYRRSYFVGSLAITERRFVAYQWQTPVVEVPLRRDWLNKLQCSARRNSLEIAFDPADFDAKHSGSVTLSFMTDKAKIILDRLYAASVT